VPALRVAQGAEQGMVAVVPYLDEILAMDATLEAIASCTSTSPTTAPSTSATLCEITTDDVRADDGSHVPAD
jgi:hypothetical protein